MKHFLILALCLCALASCATDPNAGAVAARLTGQREYVSFERDGKPDSSAVFPHPSDKPPYCRVYWTYHASCGSRSTKISADRPTPLLVGCKAQGVANVHWQPVPNALITPIRNGCLPLAIAKQRAFGGRIVRVSETHVEWRPR